MNSVKSFQADDFSVRIGEDSFSILVENEEWFILPVASALDTADERDYDIKPTQRSICESEHGVHVMWKTASNLWRAKEYHLELDRKFVRFFLRVEGKNVPCQCRFFSGISEEGGNGARYFVSEYILPSPQFKTETHLYSMAEDAEIGMQLMAPPAYCLPYCREEQAGWFGWGVAAKPGNFQFDRFQAQTRAGLLQFILPFSGRTPVDGEWETPSLLGCFGSDEWEVFRRNAEWHYQNGCRPYLSPKTRWWQGPFFCGWGEQKLLAEKYGGTIYDQACQKSYEEMSNHLDQLGLRPTAIIVDDKWQKQYGLARPDEEKWPSLRQFADEQHKKGRRVVLWFKCWDCEGLPPDFCMTQNGKPAAADPTNPKYRAYLKETINYLLSDAPGCCHCDGFKLDFTDTFPRGADVEAFEPGIAGIELLRRLIDQFQKYSKEVKADALINCSACHPYFADCMDQVRLHDYNMNQHLVKRCMSFRYRMYRAYLPTVPVDTDFPSFADHHDSMTYLRYAPTIGVPDLYRLSNSVNCEFTEEDWAEVRKIWFDYSEGLAE